jgi:hypothetical protein
MTREEFLHEYQQEIKVLQGLFAKTKATDLNYRPRPDMMSTGQVVHHLSEGLGEALRMTVTGQWPPMSPEDMLPKVDKMATAKSLEEASKMLDKDGALTADYLSTIPEEQFAQSRYGTPWGAEGKLWRLALYYLEHMQMHKMQLFQYLRIQGIPVNTMDLYAG